MAAGAPGDSTFDRSSTIHRRSRVEVARAD